MTRDTGKTLLVIPHYRDTQRLAPFLRRLMGELPPHFAILVSDDGSGAEAFAELEQLIATVRKEFAADSSPQLLDPVTYAHNRGKGDAIFHGWSTFESATLYCFADADGAVDAPEIVRAESAFRQHEGKIDALFASRVKMLGRNVKRRLLRHIVGRVFATLVSLITRVEVYDSQCGFKILTHRAVNTIAPLRRSSGFSFDVEVLLLLLKYRFRVLEFPVDWKDIRGSKVRIVSDSIKMLLDVLRTTRRVRELDSPAQAESSAAVPAQSSQ